MALTHSFAPFAARPAAYSAALRPVQSGREGFGPAVMATVWLLLLEFLICLCEALDARAAAEAAGAVVAPAQRTVKMDSIPTPRQARQALPGVTRLPRLALVSEAQATPPDQADVQSGTTTRPALAGPLLAWSRNLGTTLAVPWRPVRETPHSHHALGTPISLRYRNNKRSGEGQSA